MNSVKDLIPVAKYAKPRYRARRDDDIVSDGRSQTDGKEKRLRPSEAIKADAGNTEMSAIFKDSPACPAAGIEDRRSLTTDPMPVGAHKLKIPRLSKIRVRLGGKLPRVLSVKTQCVEEEQPQTTTAPKASVAPKVTTAPR